MNTIKRLIALLLCTLLVCTSVFALAEEPAVDPKTEAGQTEENKEGQGGTAVDPEKKNEGETAPASAPVTPEKIDTEKAKPAAPKPTATPKPAKRWFWNNTDASWTHRVFLDEELTLVEAVQRLGESCERLADMGEEVVITHADYLFGKQLYEDVELLDYTDQLFLTVAAAGHPDALEGVTLSPEAEDILAQLKAYPRWHATARARFFPIKPVRIKGKLYRGFTVELAVKGSEPARDRFIFAYYGGEWVLSKIHVGEYKVIK